MAMLKYSIVAASIGMAAAQSIFDPIIAKGTYSTLLDGINATGGAAIIEASAPVTVFGPDDSAFAAVSDITANMTNAELTFLLLNHVIVGANYTAADVVEAGCLTLDTAGGLKLGINYDAETGEVTVNGIPVIDTDIAGDYGILHGIQEVLLGPYVPCVPKILKPIEATGIYNILLEAIIRTKAAPDIADNLPVTIFGPTDDAFMAIANTISGMNEEQVKAILLNHVVADANVTVGNVVEAGCLEVPTLGGLQLGIKYDPDNNVVTVNNVTVSKFDLAGDYGILHGLDEVLLGDFVPCPVFEADFSPIAETGDYTALLDAIVTSGADKIISANAPVTIFGPKDAAFADIQETVSNLTDAALLDVLLNHVVVEGVVDARTVTILKCVDATTAGGSKIAVRYNTIENITSITTLNTTTSFNETSGLNETISFNVTTNYTTTSNFVDINGVVIDDFDIEGDYGILHGINGVLLGNETFEECPIPSLVDQVTLDGNYSTLLSFLENPVLQSQLESIGPITIFGPSDEAFGAVNLTGLSEADLVTTLGGHVVQGVYTAENVKEAGCVILDTLGGTKVRVMYVEVGEGEMHHHGHDHRRLAGHGMDTNYTDDMTGLDNHTAHNGTHHGEDYGDEDHDDDEHDDELHFHGEDYILINNAHVILADIADETSIFQGIDEVILPSDEVLVCPTSVPTVAPTTAPDVDDKGLGGSSASVSSLLLAAIMTLGALCF